MNTLRIYVFLEQEWKGLCDLSRIAEHRLEGGRVCSIGKCTAAIKVGAL